MITEEQAKQAKYALRESLGRPKWLRGVGISQTKTGFFVAVRVVALTPEVSRCIPSKINGVKVSVESVGDLTPLASVK